MSPEHLPVTLHRRVRARAGDRCEYCRLAQAMQEATFHIDHVVPRSAGGPTALDNLALACVSCSLRKGARTRAVDPVTGEEAALTKPQNATAKALAERDALLLQWQKSLSRLKKLAAAALVDDAASYRALFAAPASEQAPKRRAKSGGKKGTKESEPAPAS